MSRPVTVLHLECGTAYGGSVRCLENFLKSRTDARMRHLVGFYHHIDQASELGRYCDQIATISAARDGSIGNLSGRAGRLAESARLVFRLRSHMLLEGVSLLRLNNGPTAHPAAVLAARAARIPCVAWLRSFPSPGASRWQWTNRLVSSFVAVSESVRSAHVEAGIPSDRIRTLYDGTPLPESVPARAPGKTFRLGTLGRLVRWKGLLDIVRAAPAVLSQCPEVRMELAGSEDPAEPAFRTELLREIERLGVSDRVTIRGFSANPHDFLLSLDCLLNPSFPAEPFGMSIIEAMALERPVIATNSGGPAEIIEHERSGLLVPPGDPAALAGAILTLARQPERARQMGVHARRRAAERFDLRKQTIEQERVLYALAVPRQRGD